MPSTTLIMASASNIRIYKLLSAVKFTPAFLMTIDLPPVQLHDEAKSFYG